jgi:hypothetical protein
MQLIKERKEERKVEKRTTGGKWEEHGEGEKEGKRETIR